MGVVVRKYTDILTIIITFPYSTCISSFFGSSIPTSLFIYNCFYVIFVQYNYSKHCSKNIQDRSKIEIREYNLLNIERMSTHTRVSPETSIHVRGTA